MTVKRIVPNLAYSTPEETKSFFSEIFDLEIVMDQGWIITFASDELAQPQMSIASHGGSGTEVPAISIEVDNLDEVYGKAQAFGAEITYPMTKEDWGLRRFHLKAPSGIVINVLSHE